MRRYRILIFSALLLHATLTGCMEWVSDNEESFDEPGRGLFVLSEGNFQYGNASLSFYSPIDNRVDNEVFRRANGMKLGDVAQSMTIGLDRAWIVVNNSHVIFAIDPDTFRERGRIEGLTSPRYIHFVGDTKAYVTQLWDNRIFIVNPKNYSITGYIDVPDMEPGMGSTEQMVKFGDYVYCNCWSYQSRIIRIDTATDRVDGSIDVGIQPNSIAADCHGRLWTLCDGGFTGSPAGSETPSIVCVNPAEMAVVRRFNLPQGEAPSEICVNGDGTAIYWIAGDVWRMSVDASSLPSTPLIPSRGTRYYGLTVDPASGDVYVADAVDYQQAGKIYRYTAGGVLVDEFYAGITPGAFCWKP